MEHEYRNMRDIGKMYGKSSHQVGRELRDSGYRTPDGKPTKRALAEGMAILQRNPENPEWIACAWNVAKVTYLLEAYGWKKVDGGTDK
jgi:hypothetical protein